MAHVNELGTILAGGGEMGALMRSFDWSKTPVGPVEEWPQSLRTAVSILLDSRFPMYIGWGPEFVQFYNDGYRPVLGTKHPEALGRSTYDTWSEIWTDIVGPLFRKAKEEGEPTYLEDFLFPLFRFGYTEECYFTFCYSPIREESGEAGGVLVTCIETTARMVGERRLRTLRELATRANDTRTVAESCRSAVSVMATNPHDIPFAAIYLVDDEKTARLAGSCGLSKGHPAIPSTLARQGNSGVWPIAEVAATEEMRVVDDLSARFDSLPGGPWPEAPRYAAVVPVPREGQEGVVAILLAGISPRRTFDDDYRGFLELIAGHLARAIANTRLLDELEDANRRLSVSETRLRLANTAAGIGTWELNVESGEFVCDDQCRRILGLTETVLTYDALSGAVHEEDRERLRTILEQARRTSSTNDATFLDFDAEFRVLITGAPKWASLTGRTFYEVGETAGRPLRVVGTVHDITARRRAEEALRDEAQLIETVQRVGSALASELDLSSLVQTVTDEATKLTGAQFGAFFYNVLNENGESYTLYAISGVPREAFSKFPMPRNTKVFEPTFRGVGIVRSADITKDPRYGKNSPYFGMPEGHLPVVSYLAVPVISRSGEVLGGLFFGHAGAGMFTDEHERLVAGVAGWAAVGIDNARLYERERRARLDAETARREAEQANKAKTEFLATMSHELRTPLNAISGYVDLLDLEIRGPINEQQRSDLRRIQRSQQHLLSLINDVLNFAKLEAGQVQFHATMVPLANLVADIEQLVAPQMAARNLTYSCIGCDADFALRADEEKTRQIILNFLTNAMKFTDPGGRITVRCEERDQTIAIRVIDTGRGIPADRIDHIFEPFVQIDRHLTPTAHQGVGLGLAISRDLARAMKGDIEVESEVGSGTTFTLIVPKA